MARVLKGSQFYLHTPRTSDNGMNHRPPAFAFPAEAGTHLPTPEGWKGELALGGWLVTLVTYRNECPAYAGQMSRPTMMIFVSVI